MVSLTEGIPLSDSGLCNSGRSRRDYEFATRSVDNARGSKRFRVYIVLDSFVSSVRYGSRSGGEEGGRWIARCGMGRKEGSEMGGDGGRAGAVDLQSPAGLPLGDSLIKCPPRSRPRFIDHLYHY